MLFCPDNLPTYLSMYEKFCILANNDDFHFVVSKPHLTAKALAIHRPRYCWSLYNLRSYQHDIRCPFSNHKSKSQAYLLFCVSKAKRRQANKTLTHKIKTIVNLRSCLIILLLKLFIYCALLMFDVCLHKIFTSLHCNRVFDRAGENFIN